MKIKNLLRRALAWLALAARRLWAMLSRRPWMKVLTLLLAVRLWK